MGGRHAIKRGKRSRPRENCAIQLAPSQRIRFLFPRESVEENMSITPEQERPIAVIEQQLGLPVGFLRELYDRGDDWSFVIKAHAFLEAALTHLLAKHL